MNVNVFNPEECNQIMNVGKEVLEGQRVLIRCDFNVPIDKDGNITDDTRIVEALPTIEHLLKCGAKIILCSHHGKYKDNSKTDESKEKALNSMEIIAKKITDLLHDKKLEEFNQESEVKFIRDPEVVGEKTKNAVNELENGQILMLTNTRCVQDDEQNNITFSRKLASLCDIFVFNAFGTAHREQASTMGLMRFLTPDKIYIGELIERETNLLNGLSEKEDIVAIFGGSKLEDKLETIKSLIENKRLSKLIIVGKMALPFLYNNGYQVGAYITEDPKEKEKIDKEIDNAQEIISLCQKNRVDLVLPKDMYAATESVKDLKNGEKPTSKKLFDFEKEGISDEKFAGLDIGPKTIKEIEEIISQLKENETVVFNGTAGLNESEDFTKGTNSICEALLKSKAVVYVLGGDGVSAINSIKNKFKGLKKEVKAKLKISTGGGASLEYLIGCNLPVLRYIMEYTRIKNKQLTRKKK